MNLFLPFAPLLLVILSGSVRQIPNFVGLHLGNCYINYLYCQLLNLAPRVTTQPNGLVWLLLSALILYEIFMCILKGQSILYIAMMKMDQT